MRLLFSGSTICSEETLKRLLIIADGIAFMDRPSISFDGQDKGWGTIGSASEVRGYINGFTGGPVTLSVHSPPSGPANDLYIRYILADLANDEFRRIFLKGISTSHAFADKFIRRESNYGEYSGTEIIEALESDPELLKVPIDEIQLEGDPFRIADPQGRKEALRMLLIDASVHLTNAMVISGQIGHMPVTDDPYFGRLLAMRASDRVYVGDTSHMVPMLGLEVVKAIIPEQALQKLTLDEIMGYREHAKEIYKAWAVELGKLATSLDGLSASNIQIEIPKIIARDIRPHLLEYQNEMKSIADGLFGDLIKSITRWEVPTLSLAFVANLSFSQALGAFAAALMPAIPTLVDYVRSRREIERKHSLSYIIGLAKKHG